MAYHVIRVESQSIFPSDDYNRLILIYLNSAYHNRPQHKAVGNNPHKLCSYSSEPRTEVYCFRLNFNTVYIEIGRSISCALFVDHRIRYLLFNCYVISQYFVLQFGKTSFIIRKSNRSYEAQASDENKINLNNNKYLN